MSLVNSDIAHLPPRTDARQRAAGTLRDMRRRMTGAASVDREYREELLAQHAAMIQSAAAILPLPVIFAGFGLSFFAPPLQALGWTLATLLAYLVLVGAARRYAAIPDPASVRRNEAIVLAGHAIAGVAWTSLLFVECPGCQPGSLATYHFTVLFFAIAITAMIGSTLRGTVLAAFGPLALLLVWQLASGVSEERMALNVVLIGAIPLFAMVAETLRRSARSRLRHQAEKDVLIDQLQSARLASDQARNRAEEANFAKSRFLATMSHELRTPLNAILGFSEVMASEMLGPIGNDQYKSYVRDIHASGQHLLGLINEILDLSRVEAGRYQLNEEAFDLVRIAEDSLAFVRVKAEAKSLQLVAEYEHDLPAIWADERSMRQIAINLLSNAVKFTPKGGTITLRVGWTAGGGQYLSVVDNGTGIAEDEIETALSSFGQASNALKSAEQGTGLGLPIVQALIHLHGGSFDLASRLGEGTRAVAALPASRVLEVMEALDEF